MLLEPPKEFDTRSLSLSDCGIGNRNFAAATLRRMSTAGFSASGGDLSDDDDDRPTSSNKNRLWAPKNGPRSRKRQQQKRPTSSDAATPLARHSVDALVCNSLVVQPNAVALTQRLDGDFKRRLYDQVNFDEQIRLNVGGVSYRLRGKSLIENGHETLLGRFLLQSHVTRLRHCDGYDEEKKEYYFERLSRYFEPFYDFFLNGALHIPRDICIERFMEEMLYWKIPQTKLSACCTPFHEDEEEVALIQQRLSVVEENGDQEAQIQIPDDPFKGLRFGRLRRRLWRITEGLEQSCGWKVFEFISTTFIATSVISLILSSMPELLIERQYNIPIDQPLNMSMSAIGSVVANHSNMTKTVTGFVEPPIFQYIEYACVAYFAIEYTIRLLICPDRKKFVRKWLNMVDLVSILPAVFELSLMMFGITNENVSRIRWAFLTVRILRVIRMVRVVKLARFSPGVSNFVLTLERSKSHMQMVAIVLVMVVMFFSTLIYFCEKDTDNPGFRSIPAAFWWCIVTMTTVGYGDVVPTTSLGKFFSSGAILCGVLVLALPITIMVTNFMQVVKQNENKRLKRYKEGLAYAHADTAIAGIYGTHI